MFQNPMFLALIYFGASFIFSIVYFIVWHINPDAFIVHQEMNLRLFSQWRGLGGGRTESQPSSSTSLETVHAKYSELRRDEEKLVNELANTESALSNIKIEIERLGELHNQETAETITAFVEQEQKKFNDRLEKALSDLMKELAQNPSEPERTRIVAAYDDEVKKAREQSGLVNRTNLAQFTNTSKLTELQTKLNTRDELWQTQINHSRKITELRNEQHKLIQNWEERLKKRVGFFDFVYFSMGVATSNTFGDLIPNDRLVRIVIVVQLLLSIVLLALFVNVIAKP